MTFVGIVGYTPGSGGLVHAVVMRVVYIVGFIMMSIFPRCPPPCGFKRVSTLT